MKQYVIDELRIEDHQKIKAYLDEHFGASEVDGIYWIPLDAETYTQTQAAHTECHPLYFAVFLEPNLLSCELLVRTRNRIRCDCIDYATEAQRNQFIRLIDNIFASLDIKI